MLRATDEVVGGGFTALADVAYMYACTQHWFQFSGGYQVRGRALRLHDGGRSARDLTDAEGDRPA